MSQNINSDTSDKLPEVDQKSTKAEIINAYKGLVKKYEQDIKNKGVNQVQQIMQIEKTKKVEDYTVENIIASLENLKPAMHKVIDELSAKLVLEAKKNKEIKEAIAIQEKRLKDLFEIEARAETLEALIKTEASKREELELVYTKLKIEHKREEEEYNYNLEQERKREQIIQKEKQEEFRKREDLLKTQEDEVRLLKQKVDKFPSEIEILVAKTKEKVTADVKKEMKIEADLLAKEIEGNNKVLLTKLEYYENIIKSQKEEILSFKERLNESTKQVQEIAEKALESSSGKQTLKAVNDIAMNRSGFERDNNRK